MLAPSAATSWRSPAPSRPRGIPADAVGPSIAGGAPEGTAGSTLARRFVRGRAAVQGAVFLIIPPEAGLLEEGRASGESREMRFLEASGGSLRG